MFFTLTCFLLFIFGSVGLSKYQPMPLRMKFIIPALPGFIILISQAISDIKIDTIRLRKSFVLLVIIFMFDVNLYKYLNDIKDRGKNELIENASMQYLKKHLLKNYKNKHLMLCSDSRSHKFLKNYFSFKYPENLSVHSLINNKKSDSYSIITKTSYERPAIQQDILIDGIRLLVYVNEKRSNFLKNYIKMKILMI